MNLQRFKHYTTSYSKYQVDNIGYHLRLLEKEIIHRNPNIDIKNINLDDYAELSQSLPLAPSWHGSLMESLGVKDKVLTLELWENLFHSWSPAEHLPADSQLHRFVEDTPRGPMVKLNKSATPINEDGTLSSREKPHRAITEGLFTFAKGYSTYFLAKAADDPEILTRINKIHQRVLDQYIIPLITNDSGVRTGKDGVILKKGYEIGAVSFMHIDNRPSEDEMDGEKRKKAQESEAEPEPHIHFHVAFPNVCMDADGNLLTLNTDIIYANKSYYSSVYTGRMNEALEQEFGLKYKPVYASTDLKKPEEERTVVSYDVTEDIVPTELKEYFSTRSNNMKKSIKEKGLEVTHGAMDIAQKELKQGKIDMSPSEMIQTWRKQMTDFGYSPDSAQLDFSQKKPEPSEINYTQIIKNLHARRHLLTMERVHNAVKRLEKTTEKKKAKGQLTTEEAKRIVNDFHKHHKEYAFNEAQFKGYVIMQLLNRMSFDDAHKQAEIIFEQECELQLDNSVVEQYKDFIEGKIAPQDREQYLLRFRRDASFTSKWMKQISTETVDICNSRVNETKFVLNEARVMELILETEERMSRELGIDFKMSAGQRDAILLATTKPGATIVVNGLPGSGKSTMAEVAVKAYREKGYQICGTSIGSAATEGLAQACGLSAKEAVNSTILLMELDSGKRDWSKKPTVCLIDEAGMYDVETFNRLVKHAKRTGAKLVPIGDHFQLAPVGAGGLFQHMVNLYPTVKLTEINRQKNEAHRQIAMDIYNKDAKKALHSMYDLGMIKIVKTEEQAYALTAKLFAESPKQMTKKKCLTSLNEDCEKINSLIRENLQQTGKLTTNEAEQITVKCRDGVTRVFAIGDRIVIDENSKSDNIKAVSMINSNTGTVEKAIRNTKGKIVAMSVKLDNRTEPVIINIDRRKPPLRLSYMQTIHGAQGATYDQGIGKVSMSSHSLNEFFVMATRHKEDFTLVLSEELKDKLLDQAAEQAPTEKQIQTVRWVAIKNNLEIPPDAVLTFGGARAFLDEHHYNIGDNKNQKHPMDDFLDLIHQYSKLHLKKSHLDYTELENLRPGYVAFHEQVKRELAEYEAQKRFAKYKKAMDAQEQRIEVPVPTTAPTQTTMPPKNKRKGKGTELTI